VLHPKPRSKKGPQLPVFPSKGVCWVASAAVLFRVPLGATVCFARCWQRYGMWWCADMWSFYLLLILRSPPGSTHFIWSQLIEVNEATQISVNWRQSK